MRISGKMINPRNKKKGYYVFVSGGLGGNQHVHKTFVRCTKDVQALFGRVVSIGTSILPIRLVTTLSNINYQLNYI